MGDSPTLQTGGELFTLVPCESHEEASLGVCLPKFKPRAESCTWHWARGDGWRYEMLTGFLLQSFPFFYSRNDRQNQGKLYMINSVDCKKLVGYHEYCLVHSVRKCLQHVESMGSSSFLSFLLCNIHSTQRTCEMATSSCKLWHAGKGLTCRGSHPKRGAFMF